jgi:hypothetical protein
VQKPDKLCFDLLRTRGDRPTGGGTSEKGDELAPIRLFAMDSIPANPKLYYIGFAGDLSAPLGWDVACSFEAIRTTSFGGRDQNRPNGLVKSSNSETASQ